MLFSVIFTFALLALPELSYARLNTKHIAKRQNVRRLSKRCKAQSPAQSNTTSTTTPGTNFKHVKAAWYAGWSVDKLPLTAVSWKKYTHMTYAFALTTPDGFTLADSDAQLLPQFVTAAQSNGVKALLSIGGWTGSRYFSPNVASAAKRQAFVKSVVDVAKKYKLDGIDFDWEYPNGVGIGCNMISPDDTANFLSFLQLLRKDKTGKGLYLTAASFITPFKDQTGAASSNVAGFAKVLDHIAVMNYDIWGSWVTPSIVGPNAPLDDSCEADPARRMGSAVSAIAAWHAAGIPLNQLVLAMAAYGHSFSVKPQDAYASGGKTLARYPAFDATVHIQGAKDDVATGNDVCGAPQFASGQFTFKDLVDEQWLKADGSVNTANNIKYRFDQCSKTAYVYSEAKNQMVSFDDAASWRAKGNFIVKQQLRGFATWDAAGDYGDILLNAISGVIDK